MYCIWFWQAKDYFFRPVSYWEEFQIGTQIALVLGVVLVVVCLFCWLLDKLSR